MTQRDAAVIDGEKLRRLRSSLEWSGTLIESMGNFFPKFVTFMQRGEEPLIHVLTAHDSENVGITSDFLRFGGT